MVINAYVGNVPAVNKRLERIPLDLRQLTRTVAKEFAQEYLTTVLVYYDVMFRQQTGAMRRELGIITEDFQTPVGQPSDAYVQVGWRDPTPEHAKYVLLGTKYLQARNPLFAAWYSDINVQNLKRQMIQEVSLELATEYYKRVLYHFDRMIKSITGRLRRGLKIRYEKGSGMARVGWFDDEPPYAKYVLLGTYKMPPRNPLIAAWSYDELFQSAKKKFEARVKKDMSIAA